MIFFILVQDIMRKNVLRNRLGIRQKFKMTLNTKTTSQVFPSNKCVKDRPCPICNQSGNRMAIYESGIEHRFGSPVVPTSDYGLRICKKCGLHYLNAEIQEDYLVKLYSQETLNWQQEYTETSTTVWNGGAAQDEFNRFTEVTQHIELFRKDKGFQWLDFGCQTGELGEICVEKYKAVMSGVEVSEDYAKITEIKWNRPGSVKASLEPFFSTKERFDIISSLETLEHLASPWQKVSEFKFLIKPDGLLLITVPSAQYFYLKYLAFKIYRLIFDRSAVENRANSTARSIFGLCHTHPYNFSPKSLRYMLAECGFEVLYVTGVGWAANFWLAKKIANFLSFLTKHSVQIHPSVLVVARPRTPSA